MKIAFLIVAHNTPNHLKSLLEALSDPNFEIIVHVDKKSPMEKFAHLKGGNVSFCDNRIPVYWSESSQVQATIHLIRQALNQSSGCDYFVLITGSDYPLRGNRYIRDFFEKHKGMEHINSVEMPNEEIGKPMSRLSRYKLRSDTVISRFSRRLINNFQLKNYLRRDYKKYLGPLKPYAGGQCWALTKDACDYILHFIDHNKRVVKFFKNTVGPEEIFFQTILGNSPFKDNIKRHITYADWSAGGAHPATIGEKHIEFFEAKEKIMVEDLFGKGEQLFARKFPDDSAELVNRMNSMIERRDGAFLREPGGNK